MGLTLKLTDDELPASPAYIEFLHGVLSGENTDSGAWYRQEGEELIFTKGRFDDIAEKANFVSQHEQGKKAILMSYRLFKDFLIGDLSRVSHLVKQYHFVFIVGIPRTGGTYLTKQLFKATEIDYREVQNDLAHDGFPDLSKIVTKKTSNAYSQGLLQLAEYLTMVDIYFKKHSKGRIKEKIVVPKKFTKAIYNFELIRFIFGDSASYVFTLRHPLAMCNSLLDKSGGRPEDGKFAIRSTIEKWALNDWVRTGSSEEDVFKLDYEEVVIGYWKRYHYMAAQSGLPLLKNSKIVTFDASAMTDASKEFFFACGQESMEAEEFFDSDRPKFSHKIEALGEKAIIQVREFWESLGMELPEIK